MVLYDQRLTKFCFQAVLEVVGHASLVYYKTLLAHHNAIQRRTGRGEIEESQVLMRVVWIYIMERPRGLGGAFEGLYNCVTKQEPIPDEVAKQEHIANVLSILHNYNCSQEEQSAGLEERLRRTKETAPLLHPVPKDTMCVLREGGHHFCYCEFCSKFSCFHRIVPEPGTFRALLHDIVMSQDATPEVIAAAGAYTSMMSNTNGK